MTDSIVGELIRKADERAVACDWGAAFERLQEACAKAPEDPGVIVRLGRYQLLFGYPPDRWLPMFERAARLASFAPAARTELALAYAVAGRLQEASDTLTGVLNAKGCPPLAPQLLALLYAQNLQHAEAKELLRQAVAAFPSDLDSRFLLAQYREMELDHAGARALLDGILGLDPGNARANLALRRIDRSGRQGWNPAESGVPKSRSVVMLVDDRRIDRRVLDEAVSLQDAGWDVVVVAGETPAENPFWDEECYPDLRIMRVNERAFTIASPCGMYRYSVPYTR
ncbi:MAG TPA: tetratricopeptide repeat protein, partial [Bacteroidota bacterium]|nr:tetratricopeptide repeat protein [Bacteroidota bacterium]